MIKCQLLILDGIWVYIFFFSVCLKIYVIKCKKRKKKLNHKGHL